MLADGPVGLTDWANDFVEQQYVPRLRSHESKLIKLIRDGGTLASLILKHLEPDAAMGREDVLKLVFAAEQSGMASLTDKLQRILRIEAPPLG